jgi:putative ABC transport system ATP-binding protein
MGEILRLENVSKWVGEGASRLTILNDVSMSLFSGEFVAIMGASGSGKSTLLNILGLLDLPSSGSFTLLGKEVSKLDENELAFFRARSIGFVFQSFNLLSYLTAEQNVLLPMSYTHHAHAHARGQDLLAQVNLGHRANAYPTTLSGGERQRVAIARALANEPALILADEPTGALDSKTGIQIMDMISELHRRGTTIILVTHDELIARRAQKVMRMKDGRFQ